jgi:hypothetical protein
MSRNEIFSLFSAHSRMSVGVLVSLEPLLDIFQETNKAQLKPGLILLITSILQTTHLS